MRTTRAFAASVALSIATAVFAPGAAAYNSDPVCFTTARKAISARSSSCAIRDPLGSHAIISWFASRYLATTFTNKRTAEGKAAAWIAKFTGTKTAPGALLRGANAPDTLDTRVDVYAGKGGDARGEVVFSFPRGDQLLTGDIPIASTIASAIGKAINTLGRLFGAKKPVIPTFAEIVRSAIRSMPDGQAKAFLSQVFSPKTATTRVLREGLHPPLHFSALGHFVRRTPKGVTGYQVTTDSSLWNAFAVALLGSARSLVGASVYDKVRNAIEPALRARLSSTVKKILSMVTVRQWAKEGRENQPRATTSTTLGDAQFTSASDMASWWYAIAKVHYRAGDTEAAVLSLGHAAHYLQDNSLPHHNYGFLFKGHGEYEDRAGSYVAEFFNKAAGNWRARPSGFDALVARDLKNLRAFRGAPGALLTGKLWELVRKSQPHLATGSADLADPGFAGAKSDLARATAATIWLVLAFHKEMVR